MTTKRSSQLQVYAEVPDRRGNLIRVTSDVYRDRTWVDVRRWWYPPGAEEPVPTSIGFKLSEEEFRELLAGLRSAEEKLQW